MFTEKEITIIKALVEEEITYSVTAPSKSEADILGSYKDTLSNIDQKIGGMIDTYSKNYMAIS